MGRSPRCACPRTAAAAGLSPRPCPWERSTRRCARAPPSSPPGGLDTSVLHVTIHYRVVPAGLGGRPTAATGARGVSGGAVHAHHGGGSYARTFGTGGTDADRGRSLDGRQLQGRRGTDLSAANEPTPITTAAQGLATLTIDGNLVSYRVELSNIDSAFLAHVHHGVAGVNGPVRVNLYIPPRVPKGLDFSGLMVEDTITVPDSVLE